MKKSAKNNHGFKIPEGYLENFEARLKQKMENETTVSLLKKFPSETVKSTRILTLPKVLIASFSIAACIAIIITINTPQTNEGFDTIALSTIEDYLDSDNVDVSLDLISSEFSTEELDDLITEGSFEDETLENYLLENFENNELILE
ncbi:hypothetical protein [Patiriisocius sp. Uisw_017]|jgi:hypothetical protein|uniref:hypothetical protein n=1 Tax=Patiriisocius sp. Uisw_017 TaxID=3230968 RepID=UPI0039E8DFA5